MSVYIKDVCEFLLKKHIEFSFKGNSQSLIEGFSSLENIKENTITWIKIPDPVKIKAIKQYENILLIASKETEAILDIKCNIISCKNPKAVFFLILEHFFEKKNSAVISKSAFVLSTDIGKNVSIGHNSYINENVTIGNNVVIGNNVCIECPTKIGNDTIIHSGTIIGTDGYGYYKEDGVNHKVPHFGGVTIGERVEIGSNTCIDRGTIDDTYIGDDVKIDNLCHIAHNVKIKKRGMLIALSLLGGSCILEEDVYVAPGASIMNQIKIGSNTIVGMGAVVNKDVESNKVVVGIPAKVIRENK